VLDDSATVGPDDAEKLENPESLEELLEKVLLVPEDPNKLDGTKFVEELLEKLDVGFLTEDFVVHSPKIGPDEPELLEGPKVEEDDDTLTLRYEPSSCLIYWYLVWPATVTR